LDRSCVSYPQELRSTARGRHDDLHRFHPGCDHIGHFVSPPAQIVNEHLARLTQLSVRVDDRGHHRLACQVHVSRTRGPGYIGGSTDLHEPRAVHDERRALDRRTSVADDDSSALEDGDAS